MIIAAGPKAGAAAAAGWLNVWRLWWGRLWRQGRQWWQQKRSRHLTWTIYSFTSRSEILLE